MCSEALDLVGISLRSVSPSSPSSSRYANSRATTIHPDHWTSIKEFVEQVQAEKNPAPFPSPVPR